MKIIEKILPVPSNDEDKPKEGGHLFLDLAISLLASFVIFFKFISNGLYSRKFSLGGF